MPVSGCVPSGAMGRIALAHFVDRLIPEAHPAPPRRSSPPPNSPPPGQLGNRKHHPGDRPSIQRRGGQRGKPSDTIDISRPLVLGLMTPTLLLRHPVGHQPHNQTILLAQMGRQPLAIVQAPSPATATGQRRISHPHLHRPISTDGTPIHKHLPLPMEMAAATDKMTRIPVNLRSMAIDFLLRKPHPDPTAAALLLSRHPHVPCLTSAALIGVGAT